ncbi:MAG: hypothetical protein M3494_09750 [Actinomycetota bacterium]|nr:hypothetical protein [Rubrobacter sp.]MDQ3508283.1 hypothetical protein [Actinomycetota bacterium]
MDKETIDKPEKTKDEHEDGEEKYPKRKPRGSLFHSGDPTLAKRIEEEFYDFGVESLRSGS